MTLPQPQSQAMPGGLWKHVVSREGTTQSREWSFMGMSFHVHRRWDSPYRAGRRDRWLFWGHTQAVCKVTPWGSASQHLEYVPSLPIKVEPKTQAEALHVSHSTPGPPFSRVFLDSQQKLHVMPVRICQSLIDIRFRILLPSVLLLFLTPSPATPTAHGLPEKWRPKEGKELSQVHVVRLEDAARSQRQGSGLQACCHAHRHTSSISTAMATQNQTWPENHSNQNLRSNPSTVSVYSAGWRNERTLEILVCFCFLCSLHQLPWIQTIRTGQAWGKLESRWHCKLISLFSTTFSSSHAPQNFPTWGCISAGPGLCFNCQGP